VCRGRIRSNQYQLARLLQRKCVIDILQKHDAARADLTHKLSVVILYVYVLISGFIKRE
jgi:hypothetical protein